ncbi:glycosyltransferase family 2 protein [uncultured Alistipes sp.]|uniref:glycosyltransferase family 2 protein n=1 Tax=uncultured Alistipes sp. TaxID=538949 RepID=UPI002618DA61|nr:glycosyltransferase family 2 protein [uncultured Alistipes sp.]
MISVIVPVYNVEKYLPQCIESILSQTYANFELILINDGSNDSSPTICDEYCRKDARIRVLHQQNKGVSSARNNGIKHAQGEWITFIDSDDWVDKEYLLNFDVDKTTADIVIQGLCYRNESDVELAGLHVVDLPNMTLSSIATYSELANNDVLSLGYPWGKCYRMNILKANQLFFDESISFHEDHIFVFEYLNCISCIKLVRGTHYNYRYSHNPQSLSTKRHSWNELICASDRLIAEFQKLIVHYNLQNDAYIRRIGTYCISPRISALFNLYADKYPNRYSIMKVLFANSDIICRYYEPSSLRMMILMTFIRLKLFMLVDLYLSVLLAVKAILKR